MRNVAKRVIYSSEGNIGTFRSTNTTFATRRYGKDKSIYMNPLKNLLNLPYAFYGFDQKNMLESRKSEFLEKRLALNYSDIFDSTIGCSVDKLNRSVGIYEGTPKNLFKRSTKFYNRFKIQQYDEVLQKGFAHVFFVKPNCNLLQGNLNSPKLADSISSNPFFTYLLKSSPDVLMELDGGFGSSNHDFMLSLSNKASSFSLTDDFIATDSYGKTWTGYKIAYGKNGIESKTAGTFTINYNDDRHFHVYQLHKAWIEYISGCYRGEIEPSIGSILDKILDYASCVYYIITAEDGETILFWTKYYGVFPSTVPLAQYTWAEGNLIKNPEIDITYQYSFKDDYDPMILIDFNNNSRLTNDLVLEYEPVLDPELLIGAKTWVGAPFIETVEVDNDWNGPYYYRLRFKKTDEA